MEICSFCGGMIECRSGEQVCSKCLTTCQKKIRGFKKVSFTQFFLDIQKSFGEEVDPFAVEGIYNAIKFPQRATRFSAGYDFFSPIKFYLPPGKTIKIPTGIKAYMNPNEVLSIYVRSSTGFKYNVNLLNNVGQIDQDYFNNTDNEGHIWMGFKNHGDKDWFVEAGEAFGQGIFMEYLIADEDHPKSEERVGGIGSSSK